MKLFIFILILAAFLQSSFIPINLCLILLICRSLALDEKANYVIGFITGLFLGILTSVNLGFWPLIFVIVVKLVHLSRKSPISAYALTILPLTFSISLLVLYIQTFIFSQTFNITPAITQAALALPLFFLIRFWEERFELRPEIKLRVK